MKLVVLILFFGTAIGCSRHNERVEEPDPPKYLGPYLLDSRINLRSTLAPIVPTDLSSLPDKALTLPTKAWLDLSDQLMETAGLLPDLKSHFLLAQMGHRLSIEFYGSSRAYFPMTAETDPPGNPYSDIAGYYAQPILTSKYVKAINEAKSVIRDTAASLRLGHLEISSNSPVKQSIDFLLNGLEKFNRQLQSQTQAAGLENRNVVVSKISDSLALDFPRDLNQFKDHVEPTPGEKVSDFMMGLRESLTHLSEFSDYERAKLLHEVDNGIVIAQRTEKASEASHILKILADLWTARDLRSQYPERVRKFFDKLSRNQILAIATKNELQIVPDSVWQKITKRVDYNVLPHKHLLALFMGNSGKIMNPSDWASLSHLRTDFFRDILSQPDVRKFADWISTPTLENEEDIFLALTNYWLALSTRLSMPQQLQQAFSQFTDDEVQELGSRSSLLLAIPHPILSIARNGMLTALEGFGLDESQRDQKNIAVQNLRNLIGSGIETSTKARVNSALAPLVADLQNKIRDALESKLNEELKNTPANSMISYNNYGRYYIGRLIFGALGLSKDPGSSDEMSAEKSEVGNASLPLLEKDLLSLRKGNRYFYLIDNRSNETSPGTIGVALSHLAARIWQAKEIEGLQPESQKSLALQFQALTKMLTLASFSINELGKKTGLAVSMTAGVKSDALDIRDYDPEKGIFAFPDQIFIRDRFRKDDTSDVNPKVSLDQQMELLRGFVKMMGILKTWVPSPFDSGLASLRIDEDPRIEAFTKDDFYTLSLGLSAIILKSISKKMLGVITEDGRFYEAHNVTDLNSLNITAATLSDYDRRQMSHVIAAPSIAKALIALSDFYLETKDIEKTKSPPLLTPSVQKDIREGRDKIQTLISGLSMFACNQLHNDDGGFYHSYDVDKKQHSAESRNLEDQLLMQEGLLRASAALQSDFFAFRALDNFFFLNRSFWDRDLGFYARSPQDLSHKVDLLNVIRAIKNVALFQEALGPFLTRSTKHPFSLAQMETLQYSWLSRFFDSRVDRLPAPIKLLEFSL